MARIAVDLLHRLRRSLALTPTLSQREREPRDSLLSTSCVMPVGVHSREFGAFILLSIAQEWAPDRIRVRRAERVAAFRLS
ncbi:MAG TPA: hypothetical protein PLD05_12905, partial [Thermogutta sp.]|nr:hypothetical protein [Thermogutta sp.]